MRSDGALAGSIPRPETGLVFPGIRRGAASHPAPSGWKPATFAGRLAEISGGPAGVPLTLVFRLVFEVQRCGEPAVWIGRRDSIFYPPDVAEAGVDLAALAVVFAPGSREAAEAADLLLRSGAFGLVVLDLGAGAFLPVRVQTRLAALAQRHDTALVCITEKEERRPSLGSLVSLRAHATRTADRRRDRYRCEAHAIKDKRRGPGWTHAEVCRGPDGLC